MLSAADESLTGSRPRSARPEMGRCAADGKGSFLSKKHSPQSQPTSLACVAQRRPGASFRDPSSSEELKSRRVMSKESGKSAVWPEGWEIDTFLVIFYDGIKLTQQI